MQSEHVLDIESHILLKESSPSSDHTILEGASFDVRGVRMAVCRASSST